MAVAQEMQLLKCARYKELVTLISGNVAKLQWYPLMDTFCSQTCMFIAIVTKALICIGRVMQGIKEDSCPEEWLCPISTVYVLPPLQEAVCNLLNIQ